MALTELTKVTGPGIHTLSNVLSHNIKSSGIITATKFSGPLDSIGGNFAGVITATNGVFSGNVTIGGTLTYEDVTNIDSVGVITARNGIDCNGDIDVDGHTNLDNVSISGVTTIADDKKLYLGNDQDLELYYQTSGTPGAYINTGNASGNLTIRNQDAGQYVYIHGDHVHLRSTTSNEAYLQAQRNGAVSLYYDSSTYSTPKFTTTATGVTIDGTAVAGGLDISGDLDVDGHTNLDNVSIAGVTTFTGNIGGTATFQDIDVNGDLDVDGHTNLDNVSIAGVSTFAGNVVIADSIVHDGDTNTQIRFPAADTIRFEVGNQQAVHILPSSAGSGGARMGLGTNNPTGMLHIYGSNPPFRIQNSNDSANLQIGMWDTANVMFQVSHRPFKLATETSHPIVFHTGGLNNERLRITSDGEVRIPTGSNSTSRLTFGGGVNIYHDNNFKIENATGYLKLQSSNNLYIDGAEIFFRNAGGTNRWKIDSSGHLLPGAVSSYNIGSTGAEIGNVYIADSKNVFFGSDQDAEIYHNGSSLYMNNSTGNFYIRSGGGQILMRPSSSYDAIVAKTNEVELYYNQQNHSTPKLKTSATGITVDGEVAASQDYPNIQPTLDLNFAAVKKLDPRITFYRTIIGSYIDEHGNYRWASINEPRFDHDEVTHESKGLLMEVARTNKLSSGNNIPSGGNSGGNPGPSLVANNVEAPDGSFTARTIDYSNASSNMNSANIEFSWDNTPAGKTYSASIWVKGTQGHTINMYLDASGQGSGNLNEAKIQRTLTGKWERMSVYYTYPSGANAAFLRVGPRNLHSLGQGTATVVSFWGTTVVEESRPGSTIATPIVATTTAADYALIDGEEFSEFYNPLEHTTVMIGKRAANVAGADGRLYTISDGSSSQVAPDWDFNDGTSLRFSTNVGGSTQTLQQITSWSGINDEFKIAAGIALNNQIGVVNGTAIAAADTSCAIPTGVDRLYFGLRGDGGNQGSLTIKRFIFYPKRLPDSQLVTLTS